MRTLDDLDFYTDRTQADLVEAQTLSAIPYGAMTQAQQDRWREDLPGLLNLSDLERIISNYNAIYEDIRALVVANIGGYQSVGDYYSLQYGLSGFTYGQNTTSPLNGITFQYGENLATNKYNMVMNFDTHVDEDSSGTYDPTVFVGLGFYACMEYDIQMIGYQVGYLSNLPSQSTLTYKNGDSGIRDMACYEYLNAIELTEYNTLVMYHEVLDFLNI